MAALEEIIRREARLIFTRDEGDEGDMSKPNP
jgi:hypothetical protein